MKTIRYQLLLLWLLGLLAIPLGLIPSQVMNYLTGMLQSGSVNGAFSIIPAVLVFFLSIVGVAVLDVVRTMVKGVSLEGIIRTKSLALFSHILKASPEFFRKNKTAKVSNRIVSEVRKTESYLLDLKIGLPLAILGLVVFAYVLFFGLDKTTPLLGPYLPDDYSQKGNWFLATLIFLLSPLQVFFLLFDKKIQNVRKAVARADDDIAEISFESINSVAEIRNHYAFDYSIFRMGVVFARLRKVEIDITNISAIFSGIGPILDGVVKVMLLAVGARLCVSDLHLPFLDITVNSIGWKDYMGFAGIAVAVDSYVGQLKGYLFSWRMTKESFRRLDEFKKADQILDASTQTLSVKGKEDRIIFDNLDFDTDDGIKILSGLNLTIQPGEHIAFVGPSGCGKSTAMNLIVREVAKSSGSVSFADKAIEKCDFESLSGEVGMVQQKPLLLNTSIRNNLLLSLRRMSVKTIEDGGAPVDISRLQHCENRDDLNLCIIDALVKVALDADVARKALDNSLPENYANSPLIARLDEIKKTAREKILQQDSDLMQVFDKDEYLSSSTVLENILFGVVNRDDSTVVQANNSSYDAVVRLIRNTSLYEQLLWLGKRLFVHDQNIALRIKNHSPALFEVLDSYRVAGDNKEELSGGVGKLALNDSEALKSLKPNLQNILLELALSTNAEQAKSFAEKPLHFVDAVLTARKEFSASNHQANIDFKRFDSVNPVNSIPVREIILGGQVNANIRGAYAQVDNLIIQTLKQQDLFNELILIGLEAPVGEGGKLLSGGQAMKVAIARVLLKKPNVLLLDEATAALDEKSQARIVDLIEDDFRDKTVIMISHRLSTITNFSRILVFDRGHIVQQGKYNELAETPGLFQDLVRQERGEPLLSAIPKMEPSTQVESSSEIQRAVALSPIFADLHSEDIALLERMSRTVESKKDTVLFNRGDEGNEFFIILSGEVDFFVTADDGLNTEIVNTYGPGNSFGELSLFADVKRTVGAKAKTDLKLCIISRDELLKLIEIKPEISLSFLKVISKKLAQLSEGRSFNVAEKS